MKLHTPPTPAFVVPSTLAPLLTVTVLLASAVPVSAALLVLWSVDELPVSETSAAVSTGATVSRVKPSVADPVLPARSVSVAVRV